MKRQRLSLAPGSFAVVRLGASEPVPGWAAAATGFFSVTRTGEELSIVCPQDAVPGDAHAERGWVLLKLHGPIPFDETGVLSSLASPLASSGVDIFAISTFDTDYLLVKAEQLPAALEALAAAGHEVEAGARP